MKSMKLNQIKIDGGTQTRTAINQEAVEEYSEAVLEGAKFPPVDVFFDGVEFWLADGFHRYHGHKRAGVLDILATVHEGTVEDALKFALGANRTNGMRRTNQDKRNCVKIALAKWPEWSDRRIAETCGVSPTTVATVRPALSKLDNAPTHRETSDGRQYPVNRQPPRQPEPQPQTDQENFMNDETNFPEVPEKRLMPKIDQGMRLWILAKAHLDKIIKQDVSREAALTKAIEYCRNRLEDRK